MTEMRRIVFLVGTAFMTSAFGLKLDCIDNGDGTYSCVELGALAGLSPAETEAAKIQPEYLERAKEVCRYRAPSRRAGGMASASAVRAEAKKAARTAYNQCLLRKARELQEAKP